MRMASAMSKRSYNSFSNAGFWSPRTIKQMMVGGLGCMGGWFLRKSNPNDKEYPITKELTVNKKESPASESFGISYGRG